MTATYPIFTEVFADEIIIECAVCEQGFTFESQYIAHKMKHHKSPGYQCIKCKKWFMRSSELTTHLTIHGKEYTYYKELGCDYKNKDPRNMRVHARRHSEVLSFKCPKCGKGFKWCVQRKRHLDIALECFIFDKAFLLGL